MLPFRHFLFLVMITKRMLITLLTISLWQNVSFAQTLEDLQQQSQDLQSAVSACGGNLDCLTKTAERAKALMQNLQHNPELNKTISTPCIGFNTTSTASPASAGMVECLPLNVRITHQATVLETGCTEADERFTYAYVFESFGQLIRDNGRQAYALNTLPPTPGGPWKLDLQHMEYFIQDFDGNCRPAKSFSFGRQDINFGATPSVLFSYNLGYTASGSEIIFFAPLTGWVSSTVAKAHWGIGIPFQIGGGYISSEELIKAGLKFTPAELDTLFEGQTLTRMLQLKNTPLPGKPASHRLEIEISSSRQPCKLLITSPKEGQRLAFSNKVPGQLTIDLTASIKPTKFGQMINWSLPQWDAATQAQIEPKNRQGTHLKVTLKGLPKDLSGLGNKAFTASVSNKNCHTSTTRSVKLFFPRNGKNNPGGSNPNWFYYWKQTPAGRPHGQIVALEYGGNTVDVCKNPGVTGFYQPKFGYKVIHICDLSKMKPPFKLVFPLLDRNSAQKYSGMRTVKNIDIFAVAVLHEYQHFLHYHNWYSKISPQDLAKMDKDQDGLPDHLEPGMNFNPKLFQTYFANHPKLKKVGGDEEWLAYESMKSHKTGSLDKYDWAYPGNQWKP
jgi:hypothetical protein